MEGGRKLRIGLIAGALILTAGIYLLPKNAPLEMEVTGGPKVSGTFSMEKLLRDSKVNLDSVNAFRISQLEESLITNNSDTVLLDSLGRAWDQASVPGLAAWYFQKKANQTKSEYNWLQAAYRYFDAFKLADDSTESAYFVKEAIDCYTEVTRLNPTNLNAKTDLGVLYAEGTQEPMKGIMMLREVVAENPLHQNAQLNLGFLSMKSGQFDKAIERFHRVLEINPARIEMYLYLGEAWSRKGDKSKAIENFKIYRNLTNDPQMMEEVDKRIRSLESN